MVEQNHLERGCDLTGDFGNQREKLLHRRLVLVRKRRDRPVVGILLRRIMRLGRLVENEEGGHRPRFLAEPFVEREMGEDVIADPVLAAAHPLQRHRSVDRVGDHGEFADVEPELAATMFKVERV